MPICQQSCGMDGSKDGQSRSDWYHIPDMTFSGSDLKVHRDRPSLDRSILETRMHPSDSLKRV